MFLSVTLLDYMKFSFFFRLCSIWVNESCNERFFSSLVSAAPYTTAKRYLEVSTPTLVNFQILEFEENQIQKRVTDIRVINPT